ncbi:MAG: sulfatase [Pirellulaceae bacterium]
MSSSTLSYPKISIRFSAAAICCAVLSALCTPAFSQGPNVVSALSGGLKPNILWVTSEDNGPQLGCYGDEYADTPAIDALAARGMIYNNCWSNAPVCAPARTTLISGMFPNSLGGQHMRSQVALPDVAKLYPQLFKEAGYYCTNNSKEDYNLDVPKDLWDDSSNKAHWRNRQPGQPFFAVFNFTISHESKIRNRPHTPVHDAATVNVPPYHPDTPEVRRDWAQYYDRLTEMDREVGRVLAQLTEDGLADNTIVFYYGDHGSGMPRGKRWLYQSGLHVPLVVHVPERLTSTVESQYAAGTESDRLVSFVDFMPTVLSLCGIRPPAHLQGKAFLGKFATPEPEYIYGFRDRMDERYDMSRAVRDQQFLYIRNFYPHRPQGAYLNYMFQTPTTQIWQELFAAGKLNAAQSAFWLPKPSEELYDIEADPYQVNNLADSAEHKPQLERLRAEAKRWMLDIRDVGFMPEGEMLERAVGSSPYDVGHNAGLYPLEAIYDAADLASRPAVEPDALLKQRVASDSTIRFWVANGLLIRATRDAGREAAVKAARGMVTDPSPYVRCIANEVVARFGTSGDRAAAIKALVAASDPREGSLFVAMTAMNSLDWCEPSKSEVGDGLTSIPSNVPGMSSRYQSYVPRLVERIEAIAQ